MCVHVCTGACGVCAIYTQCPETNVQDISGFKWASLLRFEQPSYFWEGTGSVQEFQEQSGQRHPPVTVGFSLCSAGTKGGTEARVGFWGGKVNMSADHSWLLVIFFFFYREGRIGQHERLRAKSRGTMNYPPDTEIKPPFRASAVKATQDGLFNPTQTNDPAAGAPETHKSN